MPVNPTYPGVYIEEIPSGVHTITGVATSIAAFIDFFSLGPQDKAVQILSFSDFERSFGGLNTNSEASYAIQQFFLNGGSEAYVIRIGVGTVAASVNLVSTIGGAVVVVTMTAGSMVGGKVANNPGVWGNNIRVGVDYNTTSTVPDPTEALNELFNLTVSQIDPVTGQIVRSETFRNLTLRPGVINSAVDVVNQGSQIATLSNAAAAPARPLATGTLGTALPGVPAIPVSTGVMALTVDPDGTGLHVPAVWNATITYAVAPADYPGLRPIVEAAIKSAVPSVPGDSNNPLVAPLLAGATVQLMGNGTAAFPFQYRVLLGGSGPNISPNATIAINDTALSNPIGLNGGTANVQQYSLGIGTFVAGAQQPNAGVGNDGSFTPGAAVTSALIGVPLNKTGLYALEDVDLFNILCLPLAALQAATDYQAIVSAATTYCDSRRAFLIIDIPSAVKDPAGMQTWIAQNDTLRDTNNAVYFPRTLIPDPLNNFRLRDIAPSGTAAGLYALTDAGRGVWKAPAGTETTLRNVSQLVYTATDGENGVLNPLGINCLRTFPVYGNVCWGARTLKGADVEASEWKYVPVRRFALFLEESLYRGTKWVVFEPNDEPLWSQIRLNVGAFMQSLFRQGAFQGQTPKDAYFVKCDHETTTQNDIDKGIVNIVVGFAPLKPAEFVIIQIQQIAGQIQT